MGNSSGIDVVTAKLAPALFLGIVGDHDMVVLAFLVLLRCGRLWEVDRLSGMVEMGSCSSNLVGDGMGRVVPSKVMQFSSSGLVVSSDMAVDVLGMFLVIDGLSDMSIVAGEDW